jgi:hypothetical protein
LGTTKKVWKSEFGEKNYLIKQEILRKNTAKGVFLKSLETFSVLLPFYG